jgi:hypothetical protein
MNKTKSMTWLRRSTMGAAGCVIAAVAACGGSGNSRTEAGQPAATADRSESPITVAGCLQRGDGADFILTRINEPSHSVGTAGEELGGRPANTDTGAGTVERELLRSAAGAYRVEGADGLNLGELVGREVRVVGTITANMNLPRANTDRDPVQVKEGDLARIEATSVAQTAAECHSAESPAGAPSRKSQSRP